MDNIPAGTVVLVADGTKARLFRNVGESGTMSLKQEETIDASDIALQGPSGSAPPQQTPHENDERTFAKHLAQMVNERVLKNEFAHLVLVADPHTLGEMRPQLHKETQSRLVGEIAKTLTNAPIEDIERALHHVA